MGKGNNNSTVVIQGCNTISETELWQSLMLRGPSGDDMNIFDEARWKMNIIRGVHFTRNQHGGASGTAFVAFHDIEHRDMALLRWNKMTVRDDSGHANILYVDIARKELTLSPHAGRSSGARPGNMALPVPERHARADQEEHERRTEGFKQMDWNIDREAQRRRTSDMVDQVTHGAGGHRMGGLIKSVHQAFIDSGRCTFCGEG